MFNNAMLSGVNPRWVPLINHIKVHKEKKILSLLAYVLHKT